MTDIFPMDGYEADIVAGISQLNYRLLDEEPEDTTTTHPGWSTLSHSLDPFDPIAPSTGGPGSVPHIQIEDTQNQDTFSEGSHVIKNRRPTNLKNSKLKIPRTKQNGTDPINPILTNQIIHITPEINDYDSDSDVVADLVPLAIPMRARRRSSISKYSTSYEVELSESFVSTSLNKDCKRPGYKPCLADFEPIKVLGQGSYGKVLLVREKSTGRLFAQKQLTKASLVINETTIHKKNYERTLNEKSILEKVNHPNIVKLFYAFQDNNKVYLILEYLDGGEVFHHLAQQKYLSEKDASFYIAQVVLALRYLHLELKVIYRDLKPENCMLNSAGNLVLTDFGLSKVKADDPDSCDSMIGTAQYMAPEVIKGEAYDYSVDWWSLGCVAYDMLTGGPPFTGQTNERIMDKVVHSKST